MINKLLSNNGNNIFIRELNIEEINLISGGQNAGDSVLTKNSNCSTEHRKTGKSAEADSKMAEAYDPIKSNKNTGPGPCYFKICSFKLK